jgi:hypothetical protein
MMEKLNIPNLGVLDYRTPPPPRLRAWLDYPALP